MLTQTGRRARTAATLVAAALLLLGSAVGTDDAFPFGPFSMYSGTQPTEGLVRDTRVEAVDETGAVLVVDHGATGLRRAEVEGQAGRFVADPSLLAALSEAHDRLRPDEPSYDVVRVVVRQVQLQGGAPTGDVTEQVLAQWTRP